MSKEDCITELMIQGWERTAGYLLKTKRLYNILKPQLLQCHLLCGASVPLKFASGACLVSQGVIRQAAVRIDFRPLDLRGRKIDRDLHCQENKL
jgi:hypothetical protein